MYVEPDRVLFLGDHFSASPEGVMTSESASELRDLILGSPAGHYIEGHHEAVSARREIEALVEKMELAERRTRRLGDRGVRRGHAILRRRLQGRAVGDLISTPEVARPSDDTLRCASVRECPLTRTGAPLARPCVSYDCGGECA